MNNYAPASQSGMVLLFCLMFLTALTILGLSASSDTILQHQLATNLQQTELVKQTARTTLLWAEQWLDELQGPAPEACSTACEGFTVHPPGRFALHPEFANLDWWQSHGYEAGIDPLTGERLASIGINAIHPSLWVIEIIHDLPASGDNADPDLVWYRILARGSGQTDMSVSVVESVVAKSWSAGGEQSLQANGRVSWRELR